MDNEIDNEIVEEATNNTEKTLSKLYEDGSVFVKNVRKAAADRENNRKTQECQNTSSRLELLEIQAIEAEERFQKIIEKCLSAKNETYCLTIYNEILGLKKDCEKLLSDKNTTIKFISQELRKKESDYVQEIKNEEEDTKVISNRVDNLLVFLSGASFEELDKLQSILDEEYSKLVQVKEDKWKKEVLRTKKDEIIAAKERERLMLNYQEEVQKLERNNFVDFRKMRLKLDQDLHTLQQELCRVNGVHLLNREKLDYSFKVLSKQEEENKNIRVEQKRIKTKLHDNMVALKRELEKSRLDDEKMKRKYENEIKEVDQQIRGLEKQLWHIQSTDSTRFRDVWITKEEETKFMLEKVLDIDKYIAEKILGVEWNRPHLDFLNNTGPIYKEKIHGNVEEKAVLESLSSSSSSELIAMEEIFKMISEEMGFLLEDNLHDVVNPLDLLNRSVPSVDSVFRAINIENDNDLVLLQNVFSKHRSNDNGAKQIDVAKALKEYLKLKETLKKKTDAKTEKFAFPEVDNEKMVEYWRKYSSKFTDEKLWKMTSFALLKLRKVLKHQESLLDRRNDLISRNKELQNALFNVTK